MIAVSKFNRLRAALTAVTMTAVILLANTQTFAATEDTQIAIVTADKVYVRSGAANSYYPFGMLKEGSTVEILEEKYNWARVAAKGPAFQEMFGYIKQAKNEAGVVRISNDGSTCVTLGRVNLVAPNLETGNSPRHSWKPLLNLAPDEQLNLLNTIETDNQTIYAVQLPAEASGWVSMAHLREATTEEQQQWQRVLAGEVAQPETETQPETTIAAAPVVEPATPAVEEPTEPETPKVQTPEVQTNVLAREEPRTVPTKTKPQQPQPASTETPTDPTPQELAELLNNDETATATTTAQTESPTQRPKPQPIVRMEPAQPANTPVETTEPADKPAEPETPQTPVNQLPINEIAEPVSESLDTEAPQTQTPASTSPSAFVEPEKGVGKPAPPLPPQQRLDALEAAFVRLRAEPLETAEVDVLLGMYTQLKEDAANDPKLASFAKARAEQLRIWQELQTKQRDLKQLQSRLDVAGEDVQSVRYALLTAGNYTAIGRIAASTVYDGTKLPRLYRIQDPGTNRTIAYLRPNNEIDLVGMLGQLVGVMGERKYDGSLGLHIITPERLDLLAPQGEQATTTRATAGL